MSKESCKVGSLAHVPEPETPKLRIGANGVQAVPYRNYKGEAAVRHIMPCVIYFGSNEWHKEPQWLLDAWDADKGKLRTFALSGFLDGARDLGIGTAVPIEKSKQED
jgi:hypothetical protein